MAEFVDIIAGARRMCESYAVCGDCPLEDVGCNITDMTNDKAEAIERKVLAWLEEHELPTWRQYLTRIGVLRADTITDAEIRSEIATARIPPELMAALDEYAAKAGDAE